MRIKFVDLGAQNREIASDVEDRLSEINAATSYVGGPAVVEFERNFATFLGVRNVVGVASGTDALRLSLVAMGIGSGDSVITTPMTFIATLAAIVQTGARPVFVDVDPDNGNLSIPSVKSYLESGRRDSANGARAILPVDLYGMPAEIGALRTLADRFGLRLLEDSCQAHGARIEVNARWRMAGAAGADAGCYSFYPGKNLGAWGDGGAVATDDDVLADKIRHLRDHGRSTHYEHAVVGYNSRLDSIQAAVLSAKLVHLTKWNNRRRQIAKLYRQLLDTCELDHPPEPIGFEPCYHLYVIRSERRDRIVHALAAADIGCGIHYPIPLHLQPACKFLGHVRSDFPEAERFAERVVSLPMHPHLSDDEVVEVARVVRSALD